ncbi:MAG: bifunctional isocitrate dehydrogenase kinase/phosphatase [Lysobacterales bacterium]|jgi:isocitrate dehydrogenase kinase/phosphatase
MSSDAWAGIAQIILEGFDRHYALFRRHSQDGKDCFERADWQKAAEVNLKRIRGYEERVRETVDTVIQQFPDVAVKADAWPRIKIAFIGKLMNHWQAECAETFYNSVACRVLHRDYYNSEYIFWRPAISTEYLEASQPTYHSHYPGKDGLRRALLEILAACKLDVPFENLRRDLRFLERAAFEQREPDWREEPNYQLQVLHSLFFRNKAAYVVGRMVNGTKRTPFIIPLLRNPDGTMTVDCLLTKPKDAAVLFSFSRAYFLVDMEVPSAYVRFLTSIMPRKSPVDLYAMLGLQKQAKTLFYRVLHHHLRHSRDNFVIAPGVRGMVMLVFCLPSFPFVFKMIKDRFDPPKTSSAKEVRAKYTLVKNHDRVGRLADTLEYSNVAIPLNRIAPDLMAELKASCAASIDEVKERLIIRHCYIERRMEPLDNFLARAEGTARAQAIRDYGDSIRDLAGANIFPGDMLKKNFGLTRHRRVVFYDYDEISYITDCNFRRVPPTRNYEDMMSDEPWYSVKENDVFPETFGPFFFADAEGMAEFKKHHAELMTAAWWKKIQQDILSGHSPDIFPYPEEERFCNRYA